MLGFIFILLNQTISLILPNYGSIYKKTLQFPLLGNQNIETEFLKNNEISIRLQGLIDENGTAKYFICNDDIEIELSSNLKRLIDKRKTDFELINYDSIKDMVNIRLHIKPLFFNKRISLERIN